MRSQLPMIVAVAFGSAFAVGCGVGAAPPETTNDASPRPHAIIESESKVSSNGQSTRNCVFQKGFTFAAWTAGEYGTETADNQSAELVRGGVEWIALNPRWTQATRDSIKIEPHSRLSPTDDDIRHTVRAARRMGLHVFLKPQLDLTGPGWRGQIRFETEDAWQSWFNSYERFIKHYADMAKEERVSLLCVGVELDATRHRETDWRRVIASVRESFHGPLIYAANWGRETDIRWWDALDYAGVDAYFPLANKPGRSVEQLKTAWTEHRDRLRAWQAKINRPVLFTEIGYRSVNNAAIQPWEYQKRGQVALQEQANLYQAVMETFWPESWFYGLYWWQWRTCPPRDPKNDDQFTPQGKPAWQVLREYYKRPPPRRDEADVRER